MGVRPLASHPAVLVDVGLGLAGGVALLVEASQRGHGGWTEPVQVALAVAVGICLARRRRAPLISLAVTVVLLLLALPMMHSTHTALAVAMVSAATVAFQGRRLLSLAVAAALVPVVVLAWWVAGGDGVGQEFFSYLFLLLLAVVAGDAVKSRRDVAEARQERERVARQAAAREMFDDYRVELGRELHDSLAHALVAITTRAGVAAHLGAAGGGDPDLLSALADVKRVSADALNELRQTLQAWRTDATPAPVRPTGSSREALQILIHPLQSAGLDVRLHCDDEVAEASVRVGHVGYRIVQESLTNVLRHGQARTVAVSLTVRGRDELLIEVTNDGPVLDARGFTAGHGLQGMVERARDVGGAVEAGPRVQGGWLVCARLPMSSSTPVGA